MPPKDIEMKNEVLCSADGKIIGRIAESAVSIECDDHDNGSSANDIANAFNSLSNAAFTASVSIETMGALLRLLVLPEAVFVAKLCGYRRCAHLAQNGRTQRVRRKNQKKCLKILQLYLQWEKQMFKKEEGENCE